jgi:hypothetical protein
VSPRPARSESQPYEHGGPQDFKDKPADASLSQPPHVDSPTEADHLESPEPGHPVGETTSYGDAETAETEHPERIGSTTPDRDSA